MIVPNFDSASPDIDERLLLEESPKQYVSRLAESKARVCDRQSDLTLGADTAVALQRSLGSAMAAAALEEEARCSQKMPLAEIAACIGRVLLRSFELLNDKIQGVLAGQSIFNSESQGAAMNVTALVLEPRQEDQRKLIPGWNMQSLPM